MSLSSGRPPKWAVYVAILLLAWLALELCLAGRRQSATYDEANHIFAGYRYWMCSDFASNFETPPLVKLVSTFPLIFQRVSVPVALCGSTHSTISDLNDLIDGNAFLYSNDADSILFRTRLFASLFTIVLAALLFESAYVMFGVGPALIALTIFAFEPNILAHGFLVTTDMGLACCLYAAVYAFYLYLERGTKSRLVMAGIMAGAALTAKHSGLIVFPMLLTLALAELLDGKMPTSAGRSWTTNRFVSTAGAVVFVALIAYVTLWAFYGFRFAAQPHATEMSYVPHSGDNSVVKLLTNLFLGSLRAHLLPEAYLFGFKHVIAISSRGGFSPIFVLGKTYPTGKWFYFPAVLLIKSTLGFLFLLLLATLALIHAPGKHRRALSMLTIPPLLFLILCLPARLNIGIRHVLPVYPFFIVFASAGAWELCKYRGGKYIVGSLIVLHAVSSLVSFPNYIPYSNEIFGGSTRTYQVLSDSNVDWGQSIKSIKNYVRKNDVKDCWVAYFLSAPPDYYQIGCRFLPAAYASHDDMSGPDVEGTLLIGTSELLGPEELNPYAQFRYAAPVANIDGTVLVFRGRFHLPLAFALAQINRARVFSEDGHAAEAVDAARKAVGLAPDFFLSHAELARSLMAANRLEDARREFLSALSLAGSHHAEYNQYDLVQIETELRGLP
jgi:hypothetical protein